MFVISRMINGMIDWLSVTELGPFSSSAEEFGSRNFMPAPGGAAHAFTLRTKNRCNSGHHQLRSVFKLSHMVLQASLQAQRPQPEHQQQAEQQPSATQPNREEDFPAMGSASGGAATSAQTARWAAAAGSSGAPDLFERSTGITIRQVWYQDFSAAGTLLQNVVAAVVRL